MAQGQKVEVQLTQETSSTSITVQSLDNGNRTHLVLASGKLVLQKESNNVIRCCYSVPNPASLANLSVPKVVATEH